MLEFHDDVTHTLGKDDPVDIIYLDFQKAFGEVPYQQLCRTLTSQGNNRDVLNLIKGWLSDRNKELIQMLQSLIAVKVLVVCHRVQF